MTTLPAYPPASGLPRAHRVRIVTVPDRRCLAIEGESEPGSPEFQVAMGALYSASYTLHFLLRERGIDAPISPPEALWERRDGRSTWAEGDPAFDPTAWRWTLMIAVPDEASDDDIASALAVARRKRPSPALEHLFVITVREGVAVEAMHVGPYDAEPETIAKMHDVASEAGLAPRGPHHEIYLGDPRRTDPRKLRTVLRQPLH
jgi:Uncharacterized conserved protein